MKINILKSNNKQDHLVLVVEFPQDITKDIVQFLKRVPTIEVESVEAEKANAVAFKFEPLEEEIEKEMKISIINMMRSALTILTDANMTQRYVQDLSQEFYRMAVAAQNVSDRNIELGAKVETYKVRAQVFLIVSGVLLLTTAAALATTIISLIMLKMGK